jgi:glycosidase
MTPEERIRSHLEFLYGAQLAGQVWPLWQAHLADFLAQHPHLLVPPVQLSQRDAILITYGDQFRQPDHTPLQSLGDFLAAHLQDVLSGVHLLPFYPYSSDDGFAVIDYRQVDPALGSWADVARLGKSFRLMFDAVINHISAHSAWFQGFLQGKDPYTDYFITVDPAADLSQVVRPRALPLLTAFSTAAGPRHVWTTFSTDQIDLNYANPQLLLAIVDLLLFYAACGAGIIRLDAIAYLWKELGTTCIHLPQTHQVVKLFRAVLDAAAPSVLLITETNVPHEENISYFGDPLAAAPGGTPVQGDEAQLVYQFPLAPLILHTFYNQDARALSQWVAGLTLPYPTAAFFNFIASHDGIGVRPAEGLLSLPQIDQLAQRTLAHGGQVSYKSNPDGSQSVYELNITLYDALNDPAHPDPPMDINRFLASQSIMLALAGVPGIYVHSLFGSSNCTACAAETGRARSINRERFDLARLEAALADPEARPRRVLDGYRQLLVARRDHPAFHPSGPQEVLDLDPGIFALLRRSPDGDEAILCLVNVTGQPHSLHLTAPVLAEMTGKPWRDMLSAQVFLPQAGSVNLSLQPYQSAWLLAT